MNQIIYQIIGKYGFEYWELVYHYAALSGEVPTQLLRIILSEGNKNYIFNRSKHKDSFILRRGNYSYGYQLSKLGKERVLQLKYDYDDYLNSTNANTKDYSKRKRMRNRAMLFLFFDVLGIDYLKEFIDKNTRHKFIDSRTIKFNFNALKNLFSGSDNRQIQIQGSKCYGILELNCAKYLLYVFNNNVESLNYSTESRLEIFAKDSFYDERTGTIIIVDDSNKTMNSIFETIIYHLFKKEEKGSEKRYFNYYKRMSEMKFLADNKYLGMHLIGLDKIGIMQIRYLKKKDYIDETIKEVLYNRDMAKNCVDVDCYCDFVFEGCPCLFLLTLDISKVYFLVCHLTYNYSGCYYIVCFNSHQGSIKRAIENVLKSREITDIDFKFLTMEELGFV